MKSVQSGNKLKICGKENFNVGQISRDLLF